MEKNLAISVVLASIVSQSNNLTEEACRNNIKYLNDYWEKLTEEEQEEYCESFNVAKEAIHGELELRTKFGDLREEDIEL